MLKVKKLGVILKPTKLAFERTAVLNPGCWQDGEFVHLLYRAIDNENRSCIGYARLEGPTKVVERWKRPIIRRKYAYERKGVEDPRIIKIGDVFYLFYVAYDGKNAVTAYATSKDLRKFSKKGILTPKISYHEAALLFSKSQVKDAYSFFEAYYEEKAGRDVLLWEKDVFIFPRKIKRKFVLIHRILPDIQIAYFRDFKDLNLRFWKKYLRNLSKYVLLENRYWFESRNIGGGCPPIETKDGWLLIFHTVEGRNRGRIYHASAALLDRDNPTKVIGRLRKPLFSPTEAWEKRGFVRNVVFPTGTARFGNTLYIYYGAADRQIAVASVEIDSLLAEIHRSA